jgi:hypothetical protein
MLIRIAQVFRPPESSLPSSNPIKFGILGAAKIAPPALIFPAKSHPEVEVYAIAARDEKKALAFGKKYGIKKVYSGRDGYQGKSGVCPSDGITGSIFFSLIG